MSVKSDSSSLLVPHFTPVVHDGMEERSLVRQKR